MNLVNGVFEHIKCSCITEVAIAVLLRNTKVLSQSAVNLLNALVTLSSFCNFSANITAEKGN